jgi:putative transposase
VTELVHWYNHEHRHRHSAIRFVTPTQRHAGIDQALLSQRASVYVAARERNPHRWKGSTRNWSPITEVHLNPITPKNKEQKPNRKAA